MHIINQKLETRSLEKRARFLIVLLYSLVSFAFSVSFIFAEEQANAASSVHTEATNIAALPAKTETSGEFVRKAWDAQGKREFDEVIKITDACVAAYEQEADRLERTLKAIPQGSDINSYAVLNDVATCYFIKGEAYMRQGDNKNAKKTFQIVVDKYSFAQAWDPRGWYWPVAKVSKESIDKINGNLTSKEEPEETVRPVIESKISLHDVGTPDPVDYKKYGEFKNVATKDYVYEIKDQEGLSIAIGEGIFPNTTSVRWNPQFAEFQREGRLSGDIWYFVSTKDLQAAFFKWATCNESQGVKLYYTALILEKSGLIKEAIKAYYAIVVHFPGSYGWTYWHTPWYLGPASIAKIKFLLRRHPDIGWELKDAKITIVNGFDNIVANDIPVTDPGVLMKKEKINITDTIKNIFKDSDKKRIVKTVGSGKVKLAQYGDGRWELLLDDKSYMVKGVTYAPTPIGESPDEGNLANWMVRDANNNGKIDGPYDSYIDTDNNKNPVGDFQLMKDMGVNTIRLYHQPLELNKELLRKLYHEYGIRVVVGDFLGKYAIGSKASWTEGTDYSNPVHQENMLKSVLKMVEDHKDEPYVLFWLIGNENVFGVACNADKEPDSFFKFANKVAQEIKKIDKNHPVAISNGDVLFLDRFAKFAPDVDIFGVNAYRGEFGFGSLWEAVSEFADKPVLVTEFGCPAYVKGVPQDEAEARQEEYHRGNWEDIDYNSKDGFKNAIGGFIFEFLDEWWKAYEPSRHDTKGLATGPFPDGFYYEEWFGLCGQGDGNDSPFLRHLRKSYFYYQKEWTGKEADKIF